MMVSVITMKLFRHTLEILVATEWLFRCEVDLDSFSSSRVAIWSVADNKLGGRGVWENERA